MNYSINESTFQEVFEAYYRPLCRFLNLYTKDRVLIEDTIQDIFCSLWQNRKLVQIEHIQSYLYTAARNKMLNHIRNQKLHVALLSRYVSETNNRTNASDCVDQTEFDTKLAAAIASLSPKCQHVYLLSRDQRLTYKQIAEQEHISEKMVQKHISTAMRKIKQVFTSN